MFEKCIFQNIEKLFFVIKKNQDFFNFYKFFNFFKKNKKQN